MPGQVLIRRDPTFEGSSRLDGRRRALSAIQARFAAAGLTCAALALVSLGGCRQAERTGSRDADRAERVEMPREVAQLSPTERATARYQRGRTLRTSGDLNEALAEFERAIAINPDFTVAYLGAGDIYRQQGDYDRAERRYRAAVRLEPRSFDAQYKHGLVLQLLGRVHEAVRAYLRALTIAPDDYEANLNLGTAYMQLGEPEQALPFAQRAVEADPDSGPARMNLGAIYAELDRHDLAVIEYQQAAELLSDLNADLLLNMADSLSRLGRYAEMVSVLDQLIRVDPSPIAFERLGSGLFRLKQYDASLEAFRDALDRDAAHYPALNGVTVCLLNRYLWSSRTDQDALDEAVSAMRTSLRIRRDQPQIVDLLRRYGPSSRGDGASG